MDTTKHLIALGEEAIHTETLYLNLRIEKALSGETFNKEHLLNEAKNLWQEVSNEYYNFLDFLQRNSALAA